VTNPFGISSWTAGAGPMSDLAPRTGAAIAPYRGWHPYSIEHIAEDGPTVFEHACRLGAEGIVSKKVDGTYRSGPCPAWIKVRNPASIAVQRERSENWNGLARQRGLGTRCCGRRWIYA
jgi:hypothetical protein